MRITRKGFTLVELLIVIVVIGILAAMMMLSSTEAVTSAKANNIISNMRNLKTAALAYYTDNMDNLERNKDTAPTRADIMPYMSSSDISDIGQYTLAFVGDNNVSYAERSWYLVYDFGTSATEDTTRVKTKIKGRAQSMGFYNINKADGNVTTTSTPYDGSNQYMSYKVR